MYVRVQTRDGLACRRVCPIGSGCAWRRSWGRPQTTTGVHAPSRRLCCLARAWGEVLVSGAQVSTLSANTAPANFQRHKMW